MHRFLAALLFLAFFVPQAAFAQSWGESFAHTQTRDLAPVKRVLVVAPDDSGKDAAAALVEAFRTHGFTLVMTAEALGDVKGIGDAEILTRAKPLPVEGVVIVRVYPSQEAQTAVTVFTHLRDELSVSATIVQGAAPEVAGVIAPQGNAPTTESMKLIEQKARALAETLAAPRVALATTIADEKSRELNRGKFQREYVEIGVQDWQFYKGAFKTPMAPDELFKTVGRDDLAEQYSSANGLRTGVFIGSGALAALSVGMLFVGLLPAADDDPIEPAFVVTGAISGVISMTGFFIGATMDPHPVTPGEARAMAETYNTNLYRSLKLGDKTDEGDDDSTPEDK